MPHKKQNRIRVNESKTIQDAYEEISSKYLDWLVKEKK